MISCKGCPFLSEREIELEDDCYSYWDCALKFTIDGEPMGMPPASPDCKLEAVTYSLKDKKDSIDFIPKEIEL